VIVGVDFGAPQRARDQRRKIIAIAAHSTGWRTYRINATGMNARLLENDPPGWSAKELLDELLARPARVVGFDFPFCVPHALLRDPKFAAAAGHTAARSSAGGPSTGLSLSRCRSTIRSSSRRSRRGVDVIEPSASGSGRSARPMSRPVASRRSRTSSRRRSR
jgi:hypothetical protein